MGEHEVPVKGENGVPSYNKLCQDSCVQSQCQRVTDLDRDYSAVRYIFIFILFLHLRDTREKFLF
jgi:hypothetical protein